VTKALGKFVDGGRTVVVGFAQVAGCVWFFGFWVLDFGGGEGAAFGDVDTCSLSMTSTTSSRTSFTTRCGAGGWRTLAGRDVKDVEFTARGGFGGEVVCGVMADVIAVDDVVVPVSLAELEHGTLEAEGAFPAAGFGVFGEGELAGVVVP